MQFVEPALATLQAGAPAGDGWLHEVKFDGYRIQAHVSGGDVRLLTRAGLDWTKKFGEAVPAALGGLDCEDAIVDGEIVVIADSGASSFSLLQQDLSERRTDRFVYYVFDLLRLDGKDLRAEPLVERKHALQELLAGNDEEGPVRFSDHFAEPGKSMLKHVCRLGLEGIVSKRADAPYRSGRGLYWIKSKCTQRQEFVIGGYLPSEKTGRALRSLLVGYYEDGALHYAGRVGTGFSTKSADELESKLDRSKAKTSPFDAAVPDAKKVIWVKPTLVGEVEFRSWTSDRASAAAFIDGAAIARSKKPIEVRQTLSFFAIYTDPYGLHGIAVPARMVLHFVAPRGGVIELRGCSGLQQAASTDKAANLDVTRRPTASSVRRPLPERCPASSLTLRGIASCDDRVRVLHWRGRGWMPAGCSCRRARSPFSP